LNARTTIKRASEDLADRLRRLLNARRLALILVAMAVIGAVVGVRAVHAWSTAVPLPGSVGLSYSPDADGAVHAARIYGSFGFTLLSVLGLLALVLDGARAARRSEGEAAEIHGKLRKLRHDISNYLSIVAGNAEMLREDVANTPSQILVRNIEAATERGFECIEKAHTGDPRRSESDAPMTVSPRG